MSVSFGEAFASDTGVVPIDPDAARVGNALAASIPMPSQENRGFLQAARWWAMYIGKVFPLGSATEDDGAKHPAGLLGHGWTSESIGTTDDTQIIEWWTESPLSNIGIVTRANGILVLDVDPRHDGWSSMRRIAEETNLDVSRLPRSVSPRGDGGVHFWFRVPRERVDAPGEVYPHSALAPGLDRPWQVPVPPSVRLVTVDPDSRDASRVRDYRPYVWAAGDPRTLPEAPEALLGPGISTAGTNDATPADGSGGSGNGSGSGNNGSSGWPGRLGKDIADALAQDGVPVGEQSYTFKRMACSYVSRGFSDEQIIAALLETAARSPIGDVTHPWTRNDIASMVHHARRYIEAERRREAAESARAFAGIKRRML